MLFEDIIVLLLALAVFFFIIVPIYKLISMFLPKAKPDVRQVAKERLEQAKAELEAEKINKEAQALYDQMYQEALERDAAEEVEEHLRQRRV